MLSGTQPFYDEQVARLVQKIADQDADFEQESWSLVSKEAIEIIKLMLCKNPE